MPKSIEQIASETGPVPGQPVDEVDVQFGEKSGTLTTVSLKIRTLEDALRASKVDLKTWEVERFVINSWEVTIGRKNNDKVRPGTFTNYQVKAWLRRKTPSAMEVSIEKLLARIQDLSKPAKRSSKPTVKSRFMLEISLFDAHFGLLAWQRETGDNYDLNIAETSYEETMEDLLEKTSGAKPEKILLPFGNDFFHVNNPEGVTPAGGNILDVDGRLPKVFETGERALIRAVNRCAQVAPVHILWIPGNHDPQTSYFLCRVLKAHFHANKNVFVDVEPPARKYVRFGINLIGFTHGNEERHSDLPTIMAGEQRDIWSRIKHCEWHVGHLHKKKETRYSAGDTFGGVSVKILPSISGTDAWHFKKGYVKGKRMAEAFLWDYDRGLAATFCSENLRNRD